MALNYIPNQPVFFGDEAEICSLQNKPFAQLVNFGDVTQFQLELERCYNAVNIVQNGSFNDSSVWVAAGLGVTISGGKATHSPVGVGYLRQETLASEKYYNFVITVLDMTVGTLKVNAPNLFGYGTLDYEITSNGTYSFFGYSGNAGTLSIYMSGDFDGSFDEVAAYEIDLNIAVGIYTVQNAFLTKISFVDNPAYFTIDKGTITVLIDWSTIGISNKGCYYIGVIDPCINTGSQSGILNGDFSDGSLYWSYSYTFFSFYFQVLANKGVYLATTAGQTKTLDYSGSGFTNGVSYDITYTISDLTLASATVKLGTNAGTTRTANGTYTDTIVCAGDLSIVGLTTATGTSGFKIDNIIVSVTNDSDLIPNLISNNFTLGNHQCTLQVNACNDEDGLGFNFESSGFSPVIRLKAALTSPSYNSKKVSDTDSLGKANVIYFSQRKSKKLKIESVPEYVHDFLSKIGGYDRFYIDGIMYSCDDDEYQVLENDDEPNMGAVILEVSVKTQNIKNLNIGNEENNCVIGSSLWIDLDGSYVIDGANGSRTII